MRNATTSQAPLSSQGSGTSYASACSNAYSSYSSADSAFSRDPNHYTVRTTTFTHGAPSASYVVYYENATTLCDGYARVPFSPAVSISAATISYPGDPKGTSLSTMVATAYSYNSEPRPSCRISPSDCNGLWASYNQNLATPTRSMLIPPCLNESVASSAAAASSRIHGCGKCTQNEAYKAQSVAWSLVVAHSVLKSVLTSRLSLLGTIYGAGVQLLYFPVTATRDMCASFPTASLTSYGPQAVITAYAGNQTLLEDSAAPGQQTIVLDGHTFTSGTAYISISSVYAEDRCFTRYGSPVTNAILAMPSESVLSVRYSQDHFRIISETDKIWGFPVSYADFAEPVPWSAWNGQAQCNAGGYGGAYCSIIYQNQYRPQLAIPPQITQLSPDFEGCQLWFKGLYDPPRALTEAASAAKPTLPSAYQTSTFIATPASTVTIPTAAATALPDRPSAITHEHVESGSTKAMPAPTHDTPGHHTPAPQIPATDSVPLVEPVIPPPIGDNLHPNSHSHDSPMEQSHSHRSLPSSPPQAGPAIPTNEPSFPSHPPIDPSLDRWTQTISHAGQVWTASGASRTKVQIGSLTLTSGSAARTLLPSLRASYGSNGLVLYGTSTFNDLVAGSPRTMTFQDGSVHTAVLRDGNAGVVVFDNGAMTLTSNGPGYTLADGQVISAVMNGFVIGLSSTVHPGGAATEDRSSMLDMAAAATRSEMGGVDDSLTTTDHTRASSAETILTSSLGYETADAARGTSTSRTSAASMSSPNGQMRAAMAIAVVYLLVNS